MTQRRDQTPDEALALQCLLGLTLPVASWDKRFIASMRPLSTITDKEAPQLWRLFHRYRRQINHPEKARLLALAATLAAPDLRKLNAERRMRERLQKGIAAP